MARAPRKPDALEAAADAGKEIYVLERNFGAIVERAHKFWEQGTELCAEHDAELLALLRRLGAPLAPKK